MVIVKNVEGQYYVPNGFSSWLNYWERNMKKTAKECEKLECGNTEDLVGGHVYKKGDTDNIYLVPICKEHNNYTFTDEYEVPENMLLLVPKEDLTRNTLGDYLNDITKHKK